MIEKAVDLHAITGNFICVRIGGYFTLLPLPEALDEALDWLVDPAWREIGERFVRLQREVNRDEVPDGH